MRIILGLIAIACGAAMVIYSEKLLNAFGRIEFFDRYLGFEGGSRLGYKLIGLAVFFLGLMIVLNMHQSLILFIFGPLIRFSNPSAVQ